MITPSGKVLQNHGKRFCVKCGKITDQTCFRVSYRKSMKNDDVYEEEERWVCDRCHADKLVVKEIPRPTEQSMLVKLLMSLSDKYELAGTSISVGYREVRAVFRFPEHDLPRLREIADDWAERGYIAAKHLLMLERAGMADVAKIPPRWAPSRGEARREAMRSVFQQ